MPHNFKTSNPLEMVRALSDLMIDAIRKDGALGDGPVALRLVVLRDAVWPEAKRTDRKALKEKFSDALKDLSSEQKTQLLHAYARMGHLYDLAALAARENYFAKRGTPAKGVKDFLEKEKDVETAVGKLNQPVFEVVMTQHPTNTNSLKFMQVQRELAKAIETGNENTIRQALKQFAEVDILQQQNGSQKNFTVREETEIVLNFLGNIYEDLPRIYAQYDNALSGQFGQAYDPLSLNLQTRFGSWGSSGDKDGNGNVTAETTLEAMALHTHEIVSRYRKDLEEIDLPGLKKEKNFLKKHEEQLGALLTEIIKLREISEQAREGGTSQNYKLSDNFDKLSHHLARVRAKFDLTDFTDTLTAEYRNAEGGDKQKILELLRKVRVFGNKFSKIEYRETAEEYQRVVEAMVEGYKDLSPAERVEKLKHILQAEGNEPQHLLEAMKRKIIKEGAGRKYDGDDPMPIAYHTIKRMELARDHGDMIKDNVLAECGKLKEPDPTDDQIKAQGVANMLEALFLQKAVEKEGKRPLLGIVPLFEEPSTMENIDSIMRSAYEDRAYNQHLEALAVDRHGGKKTQQVQIAHSDNARRSGLQAARGYIHEAHKKIRALNDEFKINTQFFEGGSVSDAYRNGVRAVSASVNAFEMHDFAKFTFQGGDLLNYFNTPASNTRVFTRNIVHPAERFEKNGEWKVKRREHNRMDDIFDEIAIAALKRTLPDYKKNDFTTGKMGALLAVLDYDGETKAGTVGSRSGQRNAPPRFTVLEGTSAGTIKPVPIEDVRTIGFSEAWQHAGIVPSWIGSMKLGTYLRQEAEEKVAYILSKTTPNEAEEQFLAALQEIPREGLNARQISMFYRHSPTFKDAQDRAAFALALTEPEAFPWIVKSLKKLRDNKEALSYVEYIRKTQRNAAKMAHAALTGTEWRGSELDSPKFIQSKLAGDLPYLTEDILHKGDYRRFLLAAKQAGTLDYYQRALVHNGGDTVVHGRYLPADDPAYGESLFSEKTVGRAA